MKIQRTNISYFFHFNLKSALPIFIDDNTKHYLHLIGPKIASYLFSLYLGKKCDVTYRFGDILALPSNFKPNGFQEEYWFGHRINHASGKRNNLVITDLNVLRATKTIKAGDELFWDYNRDCFCRVCRKETFFLTQEMSTFSKCSHCEESQKCYKVCKTCGNFMCPKCYDNFQIIL